MSKLKQIGPATYLLEKEGGMRVPGLIFASEALLQEMDKALDQVINVAHLPGIVGYSIAMPDIHWGYGFPIGGVAAMDAQSGVISPGGVGYDINCGVRLAIIPVKFKEMTASSKEKLLAKIFSLVPSGVGHGQRGEKGLSEQDYQNITKKGASWAIEQGYGLVKDLEHIESRGLIEGGSSSVVSSHAKERGKKQLGTIGSGNHFIEIGEIEKILSPEIAKAWNIEEGLTYVMIHTGSRGFGHQVCQDTLNEFMAKGFAKGLPDRQLVAAPIQSAEGKKYFQAMAVAANFAFNNRQLILHAVRQAILDVLNISFEEVSLLYDVCHNIAKFEEHEVDGQIKKLCLHRKGATRSFGPGSKELAPIFQETGQPVMIPGDMQRASYILAGLGKKEAWASSCHGAGRAQSRIKSSKIWRGKDLVSYMKQQDIIVKASSNKTIAEEMPGAYKNVSEVVEAVEQAKLAKMVARLKPSLVMKG